MAVILQKSFSNAFLWIKSIHWSLFLQVSINNKPSAAYMRHRTGSTLFQVMVCCLFGAKPLPRQWWPCSMTHICGTWGKNYKGILNEANTVAADAIAPCIASINSHCNAWAGLVGSYLPWEIISTIWESQWRKCILCFLKKTSSYKMVDIFSVFLQGWNAASALT